MLNLNPRLDRLKAAISERLEAEAGSESTRKSRGAIYTPAHLADYVVGRALAYGTPGRVLDPACGSGHFLVAAWRALRSCWRDGEGPVARLRGIDLDAEAVERCQELLALCAEVDELELGCAPAEPRLAVGDALLAEGLGTYDLVVGNPPYVRIDRLDPAYRATLTERFGWLAGKWDLYLCFLARGLELLDPDGILALITPNQFLLGTSARFLREHLVTTVRIREVLDCCGLPTFGAAIPPAAVTVLQKAEPHAEDRIRIGICLSSSGPARRRRSVADELSGARWGEIPQEAWREGTWSVFAPEPFRRWLDRLDAPRLGDLCVRIAEGDTRRSEEASIRPASEAPPDWWPVVRGRNVLPGRVAIAPGQGGDRLPPSLHPERVLIRDVAARLVAAVETEPVRCLRTVYCAYPTDPAVTDRLAALLNTDLMTWIYLRLFYSSKMSPQAANFRFQAQFLRHLPILLPEGPPGNLEDWALEAYEVEASDRMAIPDLLDQLSASIALPGR